LGSLLVDALKAVCRGVGLWRPDALTYSAGVDDPGGAGDLVFDQKNKILYEPHISGGAI
jgi:hypothetical protein